jgi:hypothetical protein
MSKHRLALVSFLSLALLGACSSTKLDTTANVTDATVSPRAASAVAAVAAVVADHLNPNSAISKERSVYFDFDKFDIKADQAGVVERQGKYFNMVQPFQHHTNVPTNKGINVYSFALKPEEHQPSGTLNFSRIDSAVLNVTTTVRASRIRVYAVNYNVLRVMSGMGGLAYSN